MNEPTLGRSKRQSGFDIQQRTFAFGVADGSGRVVQDAATLRPGDRITARLARGRVTAEVLGVESAKPPTEEPSP